MNTKTQDQAHEAAMVAANRVLAYSRDASLKALPALERLSQRHQQAALMAATLSSGFILLVQAETLRERAKGTSNTILAESLRAALIAIVADIFFNQGKDDPEEALKSFFDQIRFALYARKVSGR